MMANDDDPLCAYLPPRRTAKRYGVTIRSIDRWVKDPRLDFPAPLYVGRMRLWSIAELLQWEAARPRGGQERRASGEERPTSADACIKEQDRPGAEGELMTQQARRGRDAVA